MQNAGLAALALNWRYLAFDVLPDQLREAILGAQRMRFLGLNLTVPHKLLAVEMVDVLGPSARMWGAVNTIRFEGKTSQGGWEPLHTFGDAWPNEIRSQGFNTDADAITQAIREDLLLPLRGTSVLVLGAGGAGRVASLKVASEGVAHLFLANRTKSKAETVAGEIAQRFPDVAVTVGFPPAKVDLLINATSLGLKPTDKLPVEPGQFDLRNARCVYDMVYRPAETPLLRAAQTAGCRVANGLSMLLYQGATALELWTDRPAPIEVMRAALQKNVYGP